MKTVQLAEALAAIRHQVLVAKEVATEDYPGTATEVLAEIQAIEDAVDDFNELMGFKAQWAPTRTRLLILLNQVARYFKESGIVLECTCLYHPNPKCLCEVQKAWLHCTEVATRVD